MATSYNSSFVKCPFYRTDDIRNIGCEGITHDSTLKLSFRTRAGKDRQNMTFCRECYASCPLYGVLAAKWEV